MKLSDIITLIGAGYTKAEIDAMEAQDQIEDPIPAAPPAAAPETPPAAAPAAPEAASPASDPELLEAIKALTAAVQHNNVVTSSQPGGVNPPDALAEADKILTRFCNT